MKNFYYMRWNAFKNKILFSQLASKRENIENIKAIISAQHNP